MAARHRLGPGVEELAAQADHVAVDEHVLPRDEDVVEDEQGVGLVVARRQRVVVGTRGCRRERPPATAPDFQSVIARQASLVTEFEINGLKVLVKRREGSQTVAAGLGGCLMLILHRLD